MKKLIIILSIFCLLLVGCKDKELDQYRYDIKEYKELSLDKVKEKIKKDTFFLYVGRENCEYCQRFLPDLTKIKNDKTMEIFYLDTINESMEMDEFLISNNIEYVPSLIYIKDNELNFIFLDHNKSDQDGKYNIDQVETDIEKYLGGN